jgi:hypothetical protein
VVIICNPNDTGHKKQLKHAHRYCASHQEMREAIVRGLDGPGMSPLDVHSSSWRHVEGFQAEMEHRQRKLAALQAYSCASFSSKADHICFPAVPGVRWPDQPPAGFFRFENKH